MYAKKCTVSHLYRAAELVAGVRLKDSPDDTPRGIRFRIATDGPNPVYGTYSRHLTSKGNRKRVPGAVCWHGHRDFLRALFSICPDAVVHTALAVYRGTEGFEREFPATAFQKTSMGYHRLDLLCDCDEQTLKGAAREVIYKQTVVTEAL